MEQTPLSSFQQSSSPILNMLRVGGKKIIYFLVLMIVGILAFFAGRDSVQNNYRNVTSPTPITSISSTTTPEQLSPTLYQVRPTQYETQNKKCNDLGDCENSICLNGYCVQVDKDMVPGTGCQKNVDCGKGEFCFQNSCYPTNYCRLDSDCEVGGACQSPCSGNDCAYASGTCGVRTKLNSELNQLDDMRGCMAAPCRAPSAVRCVSNRCSAV